MDTVAQHTKVITISKNANLRTAAAKMHSEKIGCLIVNDENGKFVGLVTERDIASNAGLSKWAYVTAIILCVEHFWCYPDRVVHDWRICHATCNQNHR